MHGHFNEARTEGLSESEALPIQIIVGDVEGRVVADGVSKASGAVSFSGKAKADLTGRIGIRRIKVIIVTPQADLVEGRIRSKIKRQHRSGAKVKVIRRKPARGIRYPTLDVCRHFDRLMRVSRNKSVAAVEDVIESME